MKTATVRDLRNHFARVSRWIEEGEPVEITKGGQPFARLMPAISERPGKPKMPDFMARTKKLFPNEKMLPAGTIQSIMDYDRGDR